MPATNRAFNIFEYILSSMSYPSVCFVYMFVSIPRSSDIFRKSVIDLGDRAKTWSMELLVSPGSIIEINIMFNESEFSEMALTDDS